MRLQLNKLTRTVWVLCLLGILVSCQDTLPKRSTITQGNTTDKVLECTEDENTVEVDENGEPVDGSELFDSPTNSFKIDDKNFFCVPKPPERPNNAVFWKPDFCACKDNRPVSYGNCGTFCADKATGGAETLFASFNVTEDISLGGLGNLFAWCKVNLPGDTQNPECELQAKDENGSITSIEVLNPANSNSITANIQDKLAYNKTYVLTLVEKTSQARSNSVQLIKFSPDSNLPILGPLKNAPISQYSCMVREFSEDTNTGDVYYETAYRLHFYFIPRIPPRPVPAGNSNLICHDIFNPLYGLVDQELYPRFEQLPGVFNLWDTTDPRFFDNNGNGLQDVNEAIVQKTRNFGGSINTDVEFFRPFITQSSPEIEDDAGNNNNSTQPMGWFMAPWIDQNTFKSYCLTQTQYNSSNPLFKAMRDIIGVDTEGLYVGGKAPETVVIGGETTSGYEDYIFIRETDLKAVWFYLNAGVPTAPTDDNVGNKAVYFYYPLNKASPFVRTSTQRVFRVLGATELPNPSDNTSGSTSSGTLVSYPPHDRKIGCVPKF